MANTGFLIQPKLKKVTNDDNEFPVDINNELCSVSGLPQATKDNPIDSETYRILNTTACPVDSGDEVDLNVSGEYFSTPSGRFNIEANISDILANDLNIDFTFNYRADGVDYYGGSGNIVITIGNTTGSTDVPISVIGTVESVTITIISVTPNPNGTKTIIY